MQQEKLGGFNPPPPPPPIQFKGRLSDGGNQQFAFHCQLIKFEAANDFCKQLVPYTSDATKFCKQLCAIASEAITLEPSEPSPPAQSPPAQTQGQKRVHAVGQEQPDPEKKKCEGFREKRNRLQEQIPEHQIGTS